MSDSDGSPQLDDCHQRRSRSRSPVSPRYAGETLGEREGRQLAEASVPVWLQKTRGRIARAAPATSQTILHIVLHWGFPGFTHVKSP